MINPYARPADQPDDADLTIPLLPGSGYAQPSQPPFTEETLVEPLPPASWDVPSAQEFGYNPTPGLTAPVPGGNAGPHPFESASYPQAAPQRPASAYPGPAAPSRTTEPNYVQPEVGGYQPYPSATAYPSAAYQATPYQNATYQSAPAPVAPWSASAPVPYTFSEAALPEHPNATTSLVLGILGIIGISPLGPIAWYLGAKGKRQMRENPGRWRPSGSLTAGVVLGAITTIFMLLALLAFVLFAGLFFISSR